MKYWRWSARFWMTSWGQRCQNPPGCLMLDETAVIFVTMQMGPMLRWDYFLLLNQTEAYLVITIRSDTDCLICAFSGFGQIGRHKWCFAGGVITLYDTIQVIRDNKMTATNKLSSFTSVSEPTATVTVIPLLGSVFSVMPYASCNLIWESTWQLSVIQTCNPLSGFLLIE